MTLTVSDFRRPKARLVSPAIVFLPAFATTPSGKIDRKTLSDRPSGAALKADTFTPRSPAERSR